MMLYKKIHRNFVRQFKKGTEFDFEIYRDAVKSGPYCVYGSIRITGINYNHVLIYPDGTINHRIYNIKIKKDVI